MSDRLAHRVLVLGHSFVWRLENFMWRTTLPCIEPDLALPQSTSLQFHGIGGRTVPFLRRYDLAVVRSFKPTILILEIGSNDLCNPNLLVNDLALDLFQLIHTLHFQYEVVHIIVGQILPRIKTPSQCHDFNFRAHDLNRILLRLLKRIPFATLWFHPKVTNHSLLLFANDGVHFNMAGNHLHHHSYCDALRTCLRRLARLPANRRCLLSRRATWPSRHRQTLRPKPY